MDRRVAINDVEEASTRQAVAGRRGRAAAPKPTAAKPTRADGRRTPARRDAAAEPAPAVAKPASRGREPARGPRRHGKPRGDRARTGSTTTGRCVRIVALARIVPDVRRSGSRAWATSPARAPVILAVNHISNGDPVVLGAWLTAALRKRRIHWLGKREIFDWPVIGWMARPRRHPPSRPRQCRRGGVPPRLRILELGYVLLVFPEGTRSPNGQLQEAKDGLAMLAMRTTRGSSRSGSTTPTPCGGRAEAAAPVPAAHDHGPDREAVPGSPTSSRGTLTAGRPRPSGRPPSWAGSPRCSNPATGASTPTPSRPAGRRPPDTARCPNRAGSPHVCEHRSNMGTVEEVRIANRTGFCYGVRRPSTRRRSRRRPGRRRIPSARSSTTRASCAT